MELPFLLILTVIGVSARYIDPIENAGISNSNLFQGDIILNAQQRLSITRTRRDVNGSRKTRAATANSHRVWPTTIPYTIDSSLYSNREAKRGIDKAIDEFRCKTCIRFKQRTSETDYIRFYKGEGCNSWVGRQRGKQDVSLDSGCWKVGTVVHEIGHALGFWHEQSRPDRDRYVKINWANIKRNRENNFKKYSSSAINSLDTPYDYDSVMHYRAYAWSKNNEPTIVPTRTGVSLSDIGQRKGLSHLDAYQINKLYKCVEGLPPTSDHMILQRLRCFELQLSQHALNLKINSTDQYRSDQGNMGVFRFTNIHAGNYHFLACRDNLNDCRPDRCHDRASDCRRTCNSCAMD